jgi:hypothetical protein
VNGGTLLANTPGPSSATGTGPVTVNNGGTLGGTGRVGGSATVDSGGVMAPGGGAGLPPATLAVAGDYAQAQGGRLRVELGEPGRDPSDRLAVSGSAALDGALEVARVNGYAATAGDSFDILTYGSRSGQFKSLEGGDAGNGLRFAEVYTPTALRLVAAMAGDANFDRRVDGSDFALLAGNFGRTGRDWTAGDFDGNGSVNGTDFALLAGNFGRSVSGPAAISAGDWAALESFGTDIGVSVPEPAGLTLLAAALGLLTRRRRSRPGSNVPNSL